MSESYGTLHYTGDLTSDVQVGDLCGSDGLGVPFVVHNVAYDAHTDRTTVDLSPAPQAVLRVAVAERRRQIEGRQAFGALFAGGAA